MESWEVVRHKLQQIVANEDKSKPLSDEAIAEKLNEEGIDIARRTVSKYRKSLNIPSSRMRKEYG
jgi:RNA polymerase sigma-54 factor